MCPKYWLIGGFNENVNGNFGVLNKQGDSFVSLIE